MLGATLAEALREVRAVEVGLPIEAIESLAAAGEPARGTLADGLRRADGLSGDRLPAMLALTRLPWRLCAEPLVESLSRETDPILCAAAAAALGEGGEAAVGVFKRLLEKGPPSARFWAVVGLGATGLPSALETLRGLLEEPSLAFAAAYSLAKARDPLAPALIFRAWQSVPSDANINFHYRLCIDRCLTKRPAPSPWYVSWRRRPSVSWEPWAGAADANAFKVWTHPSARLPGDMLWPKKPLEYYLAQGGSELPDDWRHRCPSCGVMKEWAFGGLSCPETAFHTGLVIESCLRGVAARGGRTVPHALDFLDRIAKAYDPRWFEAPMELRPAWHGVQEYFEGLLGEGTRSIAQALAAVALRRSQLGELFGVAMGEVADARLRSVERSLAAGTFPAAMPEVDLLSPRGVCACGSGRPAAVCCGPLN